MKSAVFAAAALVGAANALHLGNSSAPAPTGTGVQTYETTEVVTSYTTYCPYATSVVQGNVTYTATSVRPLIPSNAKTRVKNLTSNTF